MKKKTSFYRSFLSIMDFRDDEKARIDAFCHDNGISYSFNELDGSIDVCTRVEKWKVMKNDRGQFVLFHRNTKDKPKGHLFPGYHNQGVAKTRFIFCLEYMVHHRDHHKSQVESWEQWVHYTRKKARRPIRKSFANETRPDHITKAYSKTHTSKGRRDRMSRNNRLDRIKALEYAEEMKEYTECINKY